MNSQCGKKSFWETIDLSFLELIAAKLHNDLYMQVIKDILFFLKDEKDVSSPIKLPKPLDIESLENRFFCGIYLCCTKKQDASWRYFNSSFSEDLNESIAIEIQRFIERCLPWCISTFSRICCI